ncbi:hypothetical protein KR093_010270 [Drosophila rubida]|uniref:Fibrinogen C-terminal domain-containing protein n=1 Tax=Drosophila rubida TaxID=30044 RepID=A0AAD4PLI1_9MUSC|nr:hypothetical protein KR093_010270 [Drosophila rubida]
MAAVQIYALVILAASFTSAANETKTELANQCASQTLSVVTPLIDRLERMSAELSEVRELKQTLQIKEALITELRSQLTYQRSIIDKLIANENTSMANNSLNQTAVRQLYLEKCKDKDGQLDASLLSSCVWNEQYQSHYIAIRHLSGLDAIYVRCDYELGTPGWQLIQRRFDRAQNFTFDWATYRNGFGHPEDGGFFLGLERLHRLTSSRCHELHVHLEFANGSIAQAHYAQFQVSDETQGYALTVGAFSGNATDMLSGCNNAPFSSYDRRSANCANVSGWWCGNCPNSNLNGVASDFNWDARLLRGAKLLIRPLQIA